MEQKRKFTGKEKAVLAILVIAMIAVVGVGAYIIVSNVNSANEQAAATENTTVEYTHPETTQPDTKEGSPEVTKGNTKSKTTSKTTSGSEKSEVISNNSDSKSSVGGKTSKSSKPKSTASKSTSSKSKTKSKSESQNYIKPSGNKIPVYTPKENTSHVSDDVCYVNGKKCYVGDTITMTLNLKTPVVLINYQGYTNFDDSILEFKDSDSDSGALTNCKDATIYYNASVLSGLDFTSTGTVYYAKFKVKKPGKTTISNTFQVMSDIKDDSQVPESDCTIGIEIFD